MINVHIRISEIHDRFLEKYKQKTGNTKAGTIREAINEYFRDHPERLE